jgi:hypothetical protein
MHLTVGPVGQIHTSQSKASVASFYRCEVTCPSATSSRAVASGPLHRALHLFEREGEAGGLIRERELS